MYDPEQWNFETLIDMINASECREDDEEFKNAIDLEFEIVECWLNGTEHSDPEVMADYADLLKQNPMPNNGAWVLLHSNNSRRISSLPAKRLSLS